MKPTGDELAAVVGIDWADAKHDVCLMDMSSCNTESYCIKQTAEALTEWSGELEKRFGGGRIAVCLEQSKGALIHFLMMRGCFAIYCVNPKSLRNYRTALYPSGAKDDPVDAKLLLEFFIKHREHMRPWVPDSAETRLLASLVQDRRRAVDEKTRLGNKLKAVLKGYFPQALEVAGSDVSTAMACQFLLNWPDLASLKKVRAQTLRRFYRSRGCSRGDVIEERLTIIKEAQPLTEDEAVLEASMMKVRMLAQQLLAVLESIKAYDKRIAKLYKEHPGAKVFSSFPAAGQQFAPRLLAACGDDRGRFEKASDIQAFAGIAPVTERSGKQCVVRWRRACSKFVRQTFHEFAACSRRKSLWAQAYYEQQRAAGASHHAAIRALAFKWIRIIFRCWKDGKPYDELEYLKALRRRNSPLMAKIAGAAA